MHQHLLRNHSIPNIPLDYEYGKCQFEFKTYPVSFYELSKINKITQNFHQKVSKIFARKAYPNQNLRSSSGENPSQFSPMNERYHQQTALKKISDWQSTFSRWSMDGQTFNQT